MVLVFDDVDVLVPSERRVSPESALGAVQPKLLLKELKSVPTVHFNNVLSLEIINQQGSSSWPPHSLHTSPGSTMPGAPCVWSNFYPPKPHEYIQTRWSEHPAKAVRQAAVTVDRVDELLVSVPLVVLVPRPVRSRHSPKCPHAPSYTPPMAHLGHHGTGQRGGCKAYRGHGCGRGRGRA